VGKASLPGIEPRAGLLSISLAYKRVTALSFPPRFPLVQFPNLPLIIAFVAGWTAAALAGRPHSYAQAVSYLAMTVWAYEELAHGVNWFRRLLGVTFLTLLVMRVAHTVPG
jgi:hypothetical protein